MLLQMLDFDWLVAEANSRAKKMLEAGLYSRFNLSYQKRLDKAALGCMGELAFEQLLQQKGVPYTLDSTDFSTRRADEFDFLIHRKKVDVKVAKKTTQRPPGDSWTYGYSQEQPPASKDYVVIGWVDVNQRMVGFWGWITGERISQYPVVTKNTFAGYSYLTPNHEFPWGALNKNIALIL